MHLKNLQAWLQGFKELLNLHAFRELPKTAHIGVKGMGELEKKPFIDAMKRKYDESEAEDRGSELCSLWDEYLRDPNWHPFKVITVNGKSQVHIRSDCFDLYK